MRNDAAHLARDHAEHRAPRRDLDPHQFLGGQRKADIIRHRRQIIGAIGERDDLIVVAVLAQLLESGVQVADVRDAAEDGLAVQLDHEPQHAVCGGMLGPHVHEHVLIPEVGFPGRQRNARGVPLGVHSRRGECQLDGPFAHEDDGGSGITPRSPRRRRSRISSGRSPAASAIDSSSSE